MPSEKVLEAKKALVAEIAERLKASVSGIVVNYEGISVADDTALRKELRECDVKYTVVKNTMLGRACEEAGLAGLEDVLEGTTAIVKQITLVLQEFLASMLRILILLQLRVVSLMVKLLIWTRLMP